MGKGLGGWERMGGEMRGGGAGGQIRGRGDVEVAMGSKKKK